MPKARKIDAEAAPTAAPRAANDQGIDPAERAARLTATRNLKMARSAHAYVRGATVRFYDWLDESGGRVPEGPAVWICGDCHMGNLGPLADAKGRVAVQIRDLDQTVIGNPAHDLIRLGLSLASAARGSDLPGVATAHLLQELAAGYEAALGGRFDRAADKSNRPELIQTLLAHSVRRRWRHLAEERLETAEPRLPLGKKFWALGGEERESLQALFAQEAVHAMITGLQHPQPLNDITPLDWGRVEPRQVVLSTTFTF